MIHIDYETRSLADLKKVGAFRYAADPSTEILCAALARDDEKPLMWVNPKFGVSERGVDELLAEWLCGEQLIYAHNAQFEQSITEALGNSYFDHVPERRRWRCTAAMARKAALPSSLEKCAAVLGLAQQKDKRGSALIRKFSIPNPETGKFTDPQDDPVAFQQFLEYCRQDVVVEREIHKALKAFELRGLSLDTFLMDYDINARGLPVNVDALHHANELVRQATDKLTPEFREITGLNPTQTTAFLKWLQERGYAPDNLRAATVDEELEELEINDGPAAVVRALQIKKMLAYASVKKIPSMIACAGPRDNKVRGSILFHGAERTGRFAGRLVQPQNFKKPVKSLEDHTKDIYRMICEKASAEEIEMNYAPVIECVASCIRHFIQEPGETLLDVDYSAIEARITAWLAGEEWRMEVFRTHGKIYEMSAAQMFKIPITQVSKDLRQKGKVAELACIAEGQPVLTDRGLVPIEKVTRDMKVWDGCCFVNHGGVVYQGIKEVICYEKLVATKDHVVFTEAGEMQLGQAAETGTRLIKTGDSGRAVRMGENNISGENIQPRMDSSKSPHAMHRLRKDFMAGFLQPEKRCFSRLSEMFSTEEIPYMALQKSDFDEVSVYKRTGQRIPKLRGQGCVLQVQINLGRVSIHREGARSKKGFRDRQNRQRGQLRTGESEVHQQVRSEFQLSKGEAKQGKTSVGEDKESLRSLYLSPSSVPFKNTRECYKERGRVREQPQKKLERNPAETKRVRVYDILNAGPNNRFTVSDVLVHNCGFQGGPNALIAMGALKMGIPEDDLQDIVTKWREASPNIVDLWWKCDTAVRNALACPGHRYAVNGKIGYTVAKAAGMKFLFCDLPSGRRLSYPDPRVEQSVKWAEDGEVKRLLKPTTEQIMHAKKVDPKAWVKDDVTYAGFPTGSAVWGRIASSPGKWVENAVQAVAADIMCHGCLNAERAGYETATLIHDEWLGYKRPGQSADELIALLTDLPAWADGLPIKAEGGEVPFYTKE